MQDNEIVREWSHVEQWLLDEARQCVRRDRMPTSLALTFHGGRTSLLVETPTFCIEDADAVTDVLCRVLPPLLADQILVMWPGSYRREGHGDQPVVHVLRALLGVRDEGWRHLIHPLPFDHPAADVVAIECEPTDPWAARVQQVFDPATGDLPMVSTTPPATEDIRIAVPPDSPLIDALPAFGAA